MSAPVDVLAVMHRAAAWMPGAVETQRVREVGDAVAELIEADREYDASHAAVVALRDGVSTIGSVVHAVGALHRAQSRRAAALARVGGAK